MDCCNTRPMPSCRCSRAITEPITHDHDFIGGVIVCMNESSSVECTICKAMSVKEGCDHPKPMINEEGRFVCGSCWQECELVVETELFRRMRLSNSHQNSQARA